MNSVSAFTSRAYSPLIPKQSPLFGNDTPSALMTVADIQKLTANLKTEKDVLNALTVILQNPRTNILHQPVWQQAHQSTSGFQDTLAIVSAFSDLFGKMSKILPGEPNRVGVGAYSNIAGFVGLDSLEAIYQNVGVIQNNRQGQGKDSLSMLKPLAEYLTDDDAQDGVIGFPVEQINRHTFNPTMDTSRKALNIAPTVHALALLFKTIEQDLKNPKLARQKQV